MNIKLEISLLVLGGILRLLGVGWNVWYYFTQDFQNSLLKLLCGLSLIASSVVFLIITLFSVLSDCFKCNFSETLQKLGIGLLITIGGPLGLPLFVYAVLLMTNNSRTGDFHVIEGISKATSLIEALFESIPQIGLQVYNNLNTSGWQNPLRIAPICFSVLCVGYTVYKLCHALDKMQQYESAHSMKIKPQTSEVKTATVRGTRDNNTQSIHKADLEVEEVYGVEDY
jgi:hypothetical protein